MFNPSFYNPSLHSSHPSQIFNEQYRCYPVAMLPGPSDREYANHGSKIFMAPSALDKLTRLHITYPMLFELINGAKERQTHSGVLEFVAEEGKVYLPYWMMQTLLLQPGDLLQIKSTDLPPGRFIKLQPQSTSFLEISDPKAVLENVMRNFACLTTGDIFTFAYNDQVFEMAVLETKPAGAISVLETDLEVDFAAPVGYVEPARSGASTPAARLPSGGLLHSHGTMAHAINYSSIAPASSAAARGEKAVSSHFASGGQKLSGKKARVTPKPATPVTAASALPPARRTNVNGPQPLRLPHGKLFFGYDLTPVAKKDAQDEDKENEGTKRFEGRGVTLRGGAVSSKKEDAPKEKDDGDGDRAGKRRGGRTLRHVR